MKDSSAARTIHKAHTYIRRQFDEGYFNECVSSCRWTNESMSYKAAFWYQMSNVKKCARKMKKYEFMRKSGMYGALRL